MCKQCEWVNGWLGRWDQKHDLRGIHVFVLNNNKHGVFKYIKLLISSSYFPCHVLNLFMLHDLLTFLIEKTILVTENKVVRNVDLLLVIYKEFTQTLSHTRSHV